MSRVPPGSPPSLAFFGSVLALLAAFRALDIGVARLARLPAAAYEEAVFVDNLLARWWQHGVERVPWWLAATVVALCGVVAIADVRRHGGALRRRMATLGAGWEVIDEGGALRLLVLGITGLSAWALSCYGVNLYFNQLHLAERVLVVALWLAIAWHPLFAIPFALVAGAVAGQFTVPLGFISWTEMGVLLKFPLLFVAFWVVRAATGDRRSDVFLFAWCCLLATTYWTSGLGKLRMEWFTHPHLSLLLWGAYANGWLSILATEVVARAAEVLDQFARPLMFVTLALECGALLLLWRRWSLVGFLALAIAFHLGVVAVTGIFFWKWMAADAFLLTYLLHRRRLARLGVFTPARFALSVALIVASPIWMRAENLTWLDTPLTYTLRFEGVDARGVVYALPAAFFRPYTEAIVLGTFAGVSPHVQITRAMGVTTDRRLAESLEAARSPAEIFAIEASAGTMRFDPATSARFDDFVARYAANATCTARRDPLALRIAGVPRHLWTFPLDATLPCDVAIATVRVFELTVFVNGGAQQVIRKRLLRAVDVTAHRHSRRPHAAAAATFPLDDSAHGGDTGPAPNRSEPARVSLAPSLP